MLTRDYELPSGPARERFAHLGYRCTNVLIRHGIRTWEQIAAATDAELLSVPNLGKRFLERIRQEQRYHQ